MSAVSLANSAAYPADTAAPVNGGGGGGMLLQRDMTFVVSPPELNFHGFQPHQRYEATLTLKNQTRTAKYIRIVPPESRFFSISEPRGTGGSLKVAAGLSIAYTVYFKPEEDVDYECDLIAVTEHEKFIIPVRSIGSRGKLSFPGLVHFENCPIKGTTRSTVLLSNIGTKPCIWKATTSSPFSLSPANGRIESQSSMQVTVEFRPMALMHYESTVLFDLGAGDVASMKVTGDCTDMDIVMDLEQLVIPKTFISLERQGIVKVTNKGNMSVRYCWKAHKTVEEENAARGQLAMSKGDTLGTRKPNSAGDFNPRGKSGNNNNNNVSSNGLAQSSVRLAKTRRENLENKPMIFDDDVFSMVSQD